MAPTNIGTLASKIFELVDGLEKEDITKLFRAVFALCGLDEVSDLGKSVASTSKGKSLDHGNPKGYSHGDASAYFADKSPAVKIESLAVAARYREVTEKVDAHSKSDFEAVFSSARKNFDSSNFSHDMRNAKSAGLFVKSGKQSHTHKLSYPGQNFVDALPDRAKAEEALKRPNSKRGKGTKPKSAKGK